MNLKTLEWKDNTLILIDQTKLPNKVEFVEVKTLEDTFVSIRDMIVRGAPAIGVASAYGVVLSAININEVSFNVFKEILLKECDYLETARPTAVNLTWAVNEMKKVIFSYKGNSIKELRELLEKEAIKIHQEDIMINKSIGESLLSLLKDNNTVLTHCNAGALATSEYGTALSVFYVAKEKGMNIKAYADETRPRQQGAKLTAFELHNAGIDVTLITDNMAAQVMSEGKIDAVIVGCDRVASNGDTANKIGTMSVAILAKHFGIPVYIAAPTPTIDMAIESGKDIPIEERDGEEITIINNDYIALKDVKTYNPSFDVTPAEFITAIVTEKGIVRAPFKEGLQSLFK
ncbi:MULTISPECIES: S-methyl-5-thioribose-1-phosphate isomerase [Bacillus cereus group]|uniref:Methylthioribose-1-phosphate isomerase n=1 Tax=Bacillus thuringiensis serovar mexicanensis TaxID=180868 RepID=A0A242WD21_BACTU|nr:MULTISPECIES: S-methyl-5-thioribose-1-phosphate isomerase [Bacillus cereus group]EEM55780.1 Translation initiation factor, aIF-2BI [Bacillus thuringiensis serovar monterrey BGSC 4AJ1]MEB9674195.1 S-methyl-5-thioribose-1-phosphate isomerase [Bacillus anthracis]OTW52804.1 S-methyl-5-thioribose-1-phosphate isomerase [Bacillus thuringiensis serovar mexicanensis]OTX08745.1 S-methyl-5-thioribose-1-phosphate isomerase [Bacillus thuringiensis serovar monterrey]